MSLFEDASLIVTPNGRKASKLFSLKPFNGTGDLTVVRATTATRVNSNGLIESVASGVPRIDYTNGSCPSILVEPQRTNLALYSEQFDNAYWNKTRSSITANFTTAPDGILTADKLVENTNNASHFIDKTFTTSENVVYTCSIYAKKAEREFIAINCVTTLKIIYVNLNDGSVGLVSGYTSNDYKIEEFIDGWYRISVKDTSPSTVLRYAFITAINSNTITYLGDGTSGLYIWGAQLEAGANATSYIPTVASAVTRNADVISKTGISSLIGQTEGTLFVHFNKNYSEASERYIVLGDGTSSNRIMIIGGTGGSIRGFIRNGGITQFNISTGTAVGNNKIALSYKNNDIAFYINGVQVSLGNIATIPSTSNLYLGSDETGLTEYLNGFINSAAIWKTRLSNSELATLTTL